MGLKLSLRGVSKSHMNTSVIDQLSLEIQSGEFVALMGPSGCGKSTLLNLISGLDSPDHGEVFAGEANICTMSSEKRDAFRLKHVSFVFQFFHLLPTLNILENVCLPALVKNQRSKAYILALAQKSLTNLGIAHAAQLLPSQLSGGMLARAGVARALISEPEILLADEPTGSLDVRTGQELLNLLQREQIRLGFTLVMVTHDQEAARLADRILKMQDGKIIS
jgi:putative ABC transport system ATP-binding protein